ncbi:MAG: LLM class flavin-dependent oxidoreductase [Flavobacteriales bacterium]|nr:LLM class flavin-dependent oxidoreductase [Flavobacteriales bacterium]
MEFGIQLATSSEAWKVVQRAEELGFTHAWFYDTTMICADPFVAMAAAAMKTSKIRLATGVLIPSNRIAPTTACAFASLNQLAPGRIDFGIGTGFSGRRALGMAPVKLADMEEYIRIVRDLLNEQITEWEFEGKRRKVSFLNPEFGLINTRDPVPVHISAMGPKIRKLTARLGAHWVTAATDTASTVQALNEMNEAYRAAGKNPDDFIKTAFSGGCVLEAGESCDSPRVRAQAGPFAAVIPHNLVESGVGDLNMPAASDTASMMEGYRAAYDKYEPADAKYLTVHRGHAMFLRPEDEALVSGDFIRDVTFTGEVDELRDRLRALRDAGFDRWAVQIPEKYPEAIDDWARVIEGV